MGTTVLLLPLLRHASQRVLCTGTDAVHGASTAGLFRMDTLRARLSSPLPGCHRRVPLLERTIPPRHTAHHYTCRWRTTNPPSSPCIPTDKWARDVHNPA